MLLTNLQPFPFADSSKAQVGQQVVVVGSSRTLPVPATAGVVSALNRSTSVAGPGAALTGLLQVRASGYPSASGTALVDQLGHLIGIPVAMTAAPAAGSTATSTIYAVPANQVTTISSQVIKQGVAAIAGLGRLGIQE